MMRFPLRAWELDFLEGTQLDDIYLINKIACIPDMETIEYEYCDESGYLTEDITVNFFDIPYFCGPNIPERAKVVDLLEGDCYNGDGFFQNWMHGVGLGNHWIDMEWITVIENDEVMIWEDQLAEVGMTVLDFCRITEI